MQKQWIKTIIHKKTWLSLCLCPSVFFKVHIAFFMYILQSPCMSLFGHAFLLLFNKFISSFMLPHCVILYCFYIEIFMVSFFCYLISAHFCLNILCSINPQYIIIFSSFYFGSWNVILFQIALELIDEIHSHHKYL